MLRRQRRRRTFQLESLEQRLCLTGQPPLYPGTPFTLPQDGAYTTTPYAASPFMADINGDGRDDLIVAVSGGRLMAFGTDAQGTLQPIRVFSTGPSPITNTQANFWSTPAVVNLPNGHKGLFAALGRNTFAAGQVEDSRVFGWDAATGQLLPGWPVDGGTNAQNVTNVNGQTVPLVGTYGPIATGDLDGDGQPEVVVTSFAHFVTAFHLDGSMMWRYNNDDTIEAGAVIGDLDRDGKNEVVFGGDTTAGIAGSGGLLTILSWNGEARSRTKVGDVIQSSPVLADLDGTGTLEVVFGVSPFFDQFYEQQGNTAASLQARAEGNRVYALDFNGHVLPGWPYHTTTNDQLRHQVYGSPAVADINNDGSLDVVVLDRAGYVHVINRFGQALPGWAGGQVVPPPGVQQLDTFASPIVADVDGDGSPDIVAAQGAFLTAFDRSGNRLWTYNTAGIDNPMTAAAVGQLDGKGGLELASVAAVQRDPNRPATVSVFQLPASGLTPPWPMHRKTASGQAVQTSLPFDVQYVVGVFRTFQQRSPNAQEGLPLAYGLRDNNVNQLTVARAASYAAETRGQVVDEQFQRLYGRDPSPQERAYWAYQLGTISDRDLTQRLVATPEYVRLAWSVEDLVNRLYVTILGRQGSPDEVAGWAARIRNGLSLGDASRSFIDSEEAITRGARQIYQRAFGTSTIPPDALAALLWDLHHGTTERDAYARIVASGGNYAATQSLASWIRTVFRDVLNRDASPDDVANFLRLLDAGATSPDAIARYLVNTDEGRAQFLREQFQRLLGRQPTTDQINALKGYAKQDDAILFLVTTDEYTARNGGTTEGYVRAVYRDIGDIAPAPTADVNSWVQQINSGRASKTTLAQALLNGASYFNMVAVEDAFRYVPDNTQGFLRTGTQSATAPGQPINPNPGLVSALAGILQRGGRREDLVVTLITSSDYFARASYFKGFYRSRALRT